MPRLVYALTDTYQQLAAGKCIVSLEDGIERRIFVNENASDVAAINTITDEDLQIVQLEKKPTYARQDVGLAPGTVKLIVDTE